MTLSVTDILLIAAAVVGILIAIPVVIFILVTGLALVVSASKEVNVALNAAETEMYRRWRENRARWWLPMLGIVIAVPVLALVIMTIVFVTPVLISGLISTLTPR